MAQRGANAYGLDKQLAEKAASKYDKQSEVEAKEWIEALTQHSIDDEFGPALKSGVVLCDLANALDSSLKLKPSPSTMPFKQMENVSAFLRACRTLGVAEFDLFETVDLFELKDVGLVVRCLHALGRAMQKKPGYRGPLLGVKESTKNARQFNDAQIADARHAVSILNMGSVATMQRSTIDSSASVTFGADAAQTPAPALPVAVTPESVAAAPVPSIFRKGSSNSNLAVDKPSPPKPASTTYASPAPPVAVERKNSASSSAPPAAPVQVRGGGYGLDAELAAKASAKYDYALEAACQTWIEAVTHKSFGAGFGETLRDGQVLCLLVNTLHALCQVPAAPIKIETSTIAFKLMQNVKNFLGACRALGVADVDCFETVDLFELKDLGGVLRCVQALSRTIAKKFPEYTGPLVASSSSSSTPPKPVTPPKAVEPVLPKQGSSKTVWIEETTPSAPPGTNSMLPKQGSTKTLWSKPTGEEAAPAAAASTQVYGKPSELKKQGSAKAVWPPAKTEDETPAALAASTSRPQWPPQHTATSSAPAPVETGSKTDATPTAPIAAFRTGGGLPTRANWT
ncbi:Aste57867_24306 [Aphanomyces stellatus]|uniref:Aste57867_24306 protein n=1 Tax=Aphanomyces stellatus TaxID=120398 RepID=A0A485LQ13_9STRA|nr:hypothetical protein As57867_024231 [Aphanomyces stellatus]VFU00946.1 Aste57867_24306 [Aphanomyces stellatus]